MENKKKEILRKKAFEIVTKAKKFENTGALLRAKNYYSGAQKIFLELYEQKLAAKCLSYWVVANIKYYYEGKEIEPFCKNPVDFYIKKLVSGINSMGLRKEDEYEILIQTYKELERVFHEKLLFNLENEMFFRESSLYHKLTFENAKYDKLLVKKTGWLFLSGINFFLHWFCGHGVKIGRSVISGLIVVIVFSLLFCCFNLIEFSYKPGEQIKIIDSLYFSVVTITTVGYGDIIPKGSLGRTLVTIKIMLGYFMIGVFMSLVVSRVQKWK